ncbi:deoxyuridine 5'-triphosphate nucleotidohydrolase [Dyella sp. GSA-30]|nr:deoxyuridine 5'-triphosphate nucleotidohydrolase [Dyella sp. GSA-30]
MNIAPSIELRILDERLRTWGLPTYQSDQAAGIDLFACIDEPLVLAPQAPSVLIPTGLAMHMNTHEFCALVLPRSGLGHKRGLVMGNGTGVIDADYMAECFVSVWNRNPPRSGAGGEDASITIQPGDRIAQMLFVPIVRPAFTVVESFSTSSQRGLGGFGSTGVS